jgi:hypothetical protein
MITIRRIYLYLSSFIGMSVALAGVFMLIGLIVDQGFDAFRNFSIPSSAGALALMIAGGFAWRFYWQTVQREANAVLEERGSGTRKLYLYLTMAIGLVGALSLAQGVLAGLLVQLLDTGLSNFKQLLTPLLTAVVLGFIWDRHRRVAEADRLSGADGTRGDDIRRGYWFALALFGVNGAANGAAAFIGGLLSHLGGQAPSSGFGFGGGSWQQTLFPALAQMAAGAVAVWMFWLPSQKAAAAGDATERASRARSTLIHLVVLWATLWALNGGQGVLRDLLSRILQGQNSSLLVVAISAPLSQLIVGGLLLWYFFTQVRPTLTTPRLSEYLIAGAAFFAGLVALSQLVAALLQTLGNQGSRIEELIVNIVPGLLIGGGVWRWRWQVLEAEASGPDGSAARSYLWRKVYLYFYHLIGLVSILAGAVVLLQSIIAALLGGTPSGNLLSDQSVPLSFLLVGLGLMIYMLQLVASDTRLGALSLEQAMRQTLGDEAPTWALMALFGFVLVPVIYGLVIFPIVYPIFLNIIGQLQ